MLKRLLRYLLNYKSNIFLVVLAQLLYAVFSIFTLSMIVPFLSVLFGQVDQVTVRPEFSLTTRYVIDTFYYYMGVVIARYGQMSALFYIAGVMILLSFLSNLCRYMGMFWLAPIRSGILQDLRHDLYERILILPLSFYSEQRKGDIISRMGADVQEVEWSVFSSLQSLCRDPFLIIIFVGTLFAINVPLTLITLVILPLMGYGLAAIGRGIKKYSLKSQQLLGRMSSLFEEAVGGLRVVKGYNAEAQTYEKFKHENFQFYRLNKRVFRINELGAPLVEFLKRIQISDSFFFKGAPLVIVVSGKDDVNAALASSYMEIMAESLGLGVLYSGFFRVCAGISGKLRKLLELPKEHKVVTCMVIGYPSVKYQRIVPRKDLQMKRL